MSKNVVVVGAGIFGSIAAHLAARAGARVTVVDAGMGLAASPASACLLKPSWLTSVPREGVETGYAVLREQFGLKSLKFSVNKLLPVSIDWVDPEAILYRDVLRGTVAKVGAGMVQLATGEKFTGKVLVAAGVWSDRLVEMPPIKWLYGASLLFRGKIEPQMKVYAPYRQALAFNITPKLVWMGDGTALVEATWTKDPDAPIGRTQSRAAELFKLEKPARITAGARPFIEGHKAGYFQKVLPNTWVSSGGAKNGTLLAAWQAARFVEEAGL
jgi:glycine/D-amino acid oxidase-like deaminating enzyme